MSDLEKVCDLLKGGDSKTVVTIVGPIIRIEKGRDAVEISRKHLGGIDYVVIELNGQRVHWG